MTSDRWLADLDRYLTDEDYGVRTVVERERDPDAERDALLDRLAEKAEREDW